MNVKSMKVAIGLSLAVFFSTFNLQAADSDTLISIAGKKITAGEFERVYEKNKKIDILGIQKTEEEYLELFINYKLKVAEAEAEGLDTAASFIKEYNGYVDQLAEPYLLDQSVDSAIIRQAYERLLTDVKTSHILIQVPEGAGPKDTLAAYEKLLRIRQRLLDGEDFEKVAKATSDDPSAKENGGNIGYNTSFSTVYPYENVMFNTEVGEISEIFRTKFGYHILKVTDKRPSRGQVKAAHIMISVPRRDASEAAYASAKETIDSIYQRLQNGEQFGELAKKYSTDTRSAQNNGEMEWIDNGMPLPKTFKDSIFALENIGDFSLPFKTSYGYHIIKLIEKRDFKPFSEMEELLRKEVAKDPTRTRKSKLALIEQMKKEYNFTFNEGSISDFTEKAGPRITSRRWLKPGIDSVEFNEVLFSFAGKSISSDQFADWLVSYQRKMPRMRDAKMYIDKALTIYSEELLLAHKKEELPEKNTEFRDLTTEYHDGMLLFEISNRRVWKKANSDTAGLRAFYETHKNNYMWGERLEVDLFYCKDESTKAKVMKYFAKAQKKGFGNDYILKKANSKDSSALDIESKIYSKGENEIVDKLEWKPGTTKDFSKTMFVSIKNIREPEPKALSECRGAVVADYQKQLEEEWIKELRNKFEVEINKDVLESIKGKQ